MCLSYGPRLVVLTCSIKNHFEGATSETLAKALRRPPPRKKVSRARSMVIFHRKPERAKNPRMLRLCQVDDVSPFAKIKSPRRASSSVSEIPLY